MFATRKIGMVIAALLAVGGLAGSAMAAGTGAATTPAHARTTSVPHR